MTRWLRLFAVLCAAAYGGVDCMAAPNSCHTASVFVEDGRECPLCGGSCKYASEPYDAASAGGPLCGDAGPVVPLEESGDDGDHDHDSSSGT